MQFKCALGHFVLVFELFSPDGFPFQAGGGRNGGLGKAGERGDQERAPAGRLSRVQVRSPPTAGPGLGHARESRTNVCSCICDRTNVQHT